MLIFLSVYCSTHLFFFFFFNDTATTEIYTLSLHDALPIFLEIGGNRRQIREKMRFRHSGVLEERRSEEHTSELQSPCNLVCRLLLEKKKKIKKKVINGNTSTRTIEVSNHE